MTRRSSTGGQPIKTRRRKMATLKRRTAPKAVRRRSSSPTGQETKVARLARELNEAVEQQTATAEILRVISSSPGDLPPVFEAILENATRICEAKFGNLWLREGDKFRVVAMHGGSPEYREYLFAEPLIVLNAQDAVSRVVSHREVIQIDDISKAPTYDMRMRIATIKIAKARTLVCVPMLKDNEVVGIIAIYRQEVRPFTDKQIGLLTNFAAQAVIAIENTRLLNELRQRTADLTERTADLSEALEQQTATSEVLQVISSSPGDLQPVFEAMLANAVRICDATFGNIYRWDGDAFSLVATHNTPLAYAEARRRSPVRPNPNNIFGLMVATKAVAHVPDAAEQRDRGNLEYATAVALGGVRTCLAAPMLKEHELIGSISLFRQEIRPFTDKQIALITNFAAQAVIAIENARLLNELRQSLEQQTATSEVLQVISSSSGDLQPVFASILANATRICAANFGVLVLYENATFQVAATHNAPPAFVKLRQRQPTIRASGALGRVVAAKQLVHISDCLEDAFYKQGDADFVRFVDLCRVRSLILAPMLKENELIGVIGIYRTEVRPFTGKQIALVQNFASQAVIAIENARLLNELRGALERQTATSEVLQVISSSPGDLQPVFATMVENAVRICQAKWGNIHRWDGETLHLVASHNIPPAFAAFRRSNPGYRPHPKALFGRLAATQKVTQITDSAAVEAYTKRLDPVHVAAVELGGARTTLGVPMLKDNQLIGAFALIRQEVRPFTEKQIALVENFAAQAVIAIENVRLLNELRQRTDDLSEALEQQTATSEVLRVISSSPGELKPVFSAMLESATRICEATFGSMLLRDGDEYRRTALHNAPKKFLDFNNNAPILRRGTAPSVDRVIDTRQAVHIHDLAADDANEPIAKYGGARTLLVVPMLKENEAIGVIGIYRQEVRPFSDKQIELVTNFAAQAVIAIENARLLNELRQRTTDLTERTADLTEALEQQTATSEVLQVISSSPGDLQPVFATMLENAVRICDAKFGNIYRWDGEFLHLLAAHNTPAALAEVRRRSAFRPSQTPIRRMVETKTPTHIVDLAVDPDYVERRTPSTVAAVELGGVRSLLSVPLLKENELIGSFSLYRQEVHSFTDKQIELVQNFAAQAVIAVENTRLLNELRQRTTDLTESLEQQTATSNVLQVISSSPGELEPVFAAMLASAAHICEAKFGNLFLREGEAFRAVAWHGEATYVDKWKGEALIIRTDGPEIPLERLAATKQRVHIADLRHEAAYKAGFAQLVTLIDKGGARTLLIVPMLKEHTLVGAIALYRQDVRPFTDKQITLVENFAAQAVIAIENTRLLNELRESLQQQTATADVLKVISRSTFDLQTVLETLIELAARLCAADKGTIQLGEGDVYRVRAHYGLAREAVEYALLRPSRRDRGSAAGRVALEGKAIQIPDVLADPEYHATDYQQAFGYRTILGVPLLRDGKTIGSFSLCRDEVSPFSDKQIELVTVFADQAVIAVENARLLTELRESLQQQSATADVLKVISRSAFDLQIVLDTLVEFAARLCDADSAAIHRPDGNNYPYVASYGYTREYHEYVRERPIIPGRGTVLGRAVTECKPIQVNDVEVDREYTLREGQRLGGFRTVLGIPLLREGVPIGVIVLTRKTVRPFTDKQIELATTFADQAAIAIQNVRLFEAEQQRTQELARSLEELRTAQDRLVQTEKLASLGQLTAGIAHEIKNPLNFVNNFSAVSVELIDELREALGGAHLDSKLRAEISEIADTLKGNLDKVVQHGKRADAIVKNMLLHSRQGSGEHRPVDINALVDDSLNLAYHGARAERQGFNITLERSFDPAAGEVDLFPQEITRALLNLISNGFYAATKRKAEANGGNHEPMLAAATKSLGDSIEIRIRDNGTGIPPEVREKLFNPFFTTKPAGEGTGLGLSISHDIIVKQHGGSIEVDTQPGEFTEFRIVLPRAGASLIKPGER